MGGHLSAQGTFTSYYEIHFLLQMTTTPIHSDFYTTHIAQRVTDFGERPVPKGEGIYFHSWRDEWYFKGFCVRKGFNAGLLGSKFFCVCVAHEEQ